MPGISNEKDLEISTSRLEAFSDGVFAIAITLLILQIKLPENKSLGDSSLQFYLIRLWPVFVAYTLSFMVIGIYWANHHYIFKFYVKTDHTFLILNLLFLMSISFLPFPTAIVGTYITTLSHRGTAVTFYAIALFLPAFFWFMIWLYAIHRERLVDQRLTTKFKQYTTRLLLLSNILYLSSIVISLFYPAVSAVLSVFLTLFYLLPPKKPQYKDE